jgi:hypothetical protein
VIVGVDIHPAANTRRTGERKENPMLRRIAALICLLTFTSCCGLKAASAQTQARAVVELFTSQGCSSCPAADRLLGELAGDPALIAMSVHIDYWDYIGWKDTLADPRNTARQRGYAYARGDGKVYTPQAVVNGTVHALGSNRAAIEEAIVKSRKLGAMSLPPVKFGLADGRFDIAIPDGTEERTAEVWLWGLAKVVTVAIARGENKGRDITYHNVVRRCLKIGDWNGRANSWSVPLTALAGDGIDRAAVLVQTGRLEKPKAILGAALASIR